MANKEPGRPPGAPNKGNEYARNQTCKIRCSEGFNNVLDKMVSTGQYKSKADALHEALQLLAYRRDISDKQFNYWKSRIL